MYFQSQPYSKWLIGLTFLLPITASSATYYVSSSQGNDSNNGLSETTPWKTLDKVNAVRLEDNSTVSFKRGDTFRGRILTTSSPQGVTFSAYGSGNNPILAGSVQIVGWKKTTNTKLNTTKVYEADTSTLPITEEGIHHLFANSDLMTIARYPNVNSPKEKKWLKVGATAGTTGFTDLALVTYKKPDNYWKDATLRIRNYSWTYTIGKITGFTAATGKITSDRLANQLPEWGYFLDNKLEELDYPGEWYYDAVAKKVYFYPPADKDPNQMLIEGTTFGQGILIGTQEHRTTVKDLAIRHYTQFGVRIVSSNNVTVDNCQFEHNATGVLIWDSTDAIVQRNTFNNQLKGAISLLAPPATATAPNNLIQDNQITNTAMYPVYGERFDGVYLGIGIGGGGKGYQVRRNTIDTTSQSGIYLNGGSTLVENNIVRNSLILLNDGSAVQISSNGNTIRGNILLNSVGNIDESNGCGSVQSTPCSHHPAYGMGIGADPVFTDNVIEGNTVANNTDQGIRLNSFLRTIVRNNVMYNNGDKQLVVEDKKGPSNNNVFEGNIIFPLHPNHLAVKLTGTTEHGTFNNNYYCNPFSEVMFMRNDKYYSLARWRQAFPTYDKTSRGCTIKLQQYQVTNASPSLITNSLFDANVTGWKGSGSASIIFDAAQTLLTAGSLKVNYQGTGVATVTSNDLAFTAKQLYRLKFSVVGSGLGNVRIRINDIQAGTNILHEQFFAYDKTRKDYELFFISPVTTTLGKILWGTTAEDIHPYWLDSITFEPVTATLNDATQKAVLFLNTTANSKVTDLAGVTYTDLNGKTVTGSITLNPYSSQILIYAAGTPIVATAKLTISKIGTGAGTVTAPAGTTTGINCGAQCVETYTKNVPITLTATPATGSVFTGWQGTGCANSITLTADMTCTAVFDLAPVQPTTRKLTVKLNGSGKVTTSPRGIYCGRTCTFSWATGTAVTLVATATLGNEFVGYSGDADCSDGKVTLNADVNCIATFQPTPPPVPVVEVFPCPTDRDTISGSCNGEGGTLQNVTIAKDANISDVQLAGTVINEGIVSNATITAGATVSGGIFTGSVTNQGKMSNIDFRGSQLTGGQLESSIINSSTSTIQNVQLLPNTQINGGKLAGTITGDEQASATLTNVTVPAGTQLTNVTLGANDQVMAGAILGGRIQNAGNNTLANVHLQANAHLSGGTVAGEITGEAAGVALLDNLAIAPATELSQIAVGDNVQMAEDVVMTDVEFRGQTLANVELAGTIRNTGTGTLQDVLFQPNAHLIGGKVAGTIIGDDRGPVQLENVAIQAGSELSTVLIGQGVQIPNDVIIDPGTVHFANSQAIPADLELINWLTEIRGQLTCASQVTFPRRVDLSKNVFPGTESILTAILRIADLATVGWQTLVQDDLYAYLLTNQDVTSVALQPISIKRATTEGAKLQNDSQQAVTFITDTGLAIATQPAVQAPCELQKALAAFGLNNFTVHNNGNIQIPGEGWYVSIRPNRTAQVSTTLRPAPEIFFQPLPEEPSLTTSVLSFLDRTGTRREQGYYPTPAQPQALLTGTQALQFAENGLLNFQFEAQSYRGITDYVVFSADANSLQIEALTDLNDDGNADFSLLYPTGERQTLFAIP